MTTVLDVPALQGPPDITGALQMLSEGMADRRKNREEETKRLLAQNIGSRIAGGDMAGAANAAFGSGDMQTGLKIHELGRDDQKRFAETVVRHVMLANPKTWPGLRQKLIDLTGEDPGENLEEAKAGILAEHADLDTILGAQETETDNTRADEQLRISQERLDLDRERNGGAKPPTNFQFSPDGSTLEPIPGGPADPAVIREQAEARTAGKPARVLPQGAINKLTDVGATYDSFSRLTGTFQDDYGGKFVGAVGSAENLLGRNVGLGYGDQANWWQDYQAQKNIVRHNLFGSALTATEKAEFDKANINPGMTPEIIRRNLERQNVATQKAAKKLAGVYLAQGYSEEAVEAAIGVPLADLGLGDLTAGPAAPEGAPAVGAIEDGHRFLGGDPGDPASWEKVR